MQFFRSIILFLTLTIGILLPTEKAYASNLHLILGADYVVSDVKYTNDAKNQEYTPPKDDFKSFSPVIGLTAYGIGLEAYILNSNTIKQDSLEAKIRAYGFDVFGEAGLSDNFSLIASLGLTKYTFKVEKDNQKIENDCTGPRIGVGLQYYISSNISILGMYHYTLLNSGNKDIYKAVSEISAGLRFIF